MVQIVITSLDLEGVDTQRLQPSIDGNNGLLGSSAGCTELNKA